MLNLSFVRTFVMLAEARSFVEAGRRLGLAQPTVSLQLKKLETALGVALVDRNRTGVELTVRGRSVLPYAKALLQSAEAFSGAAEGRRITIGCSGNIASYYLSDDLKRFMDLEVDDFAWDVEVAPNPDILELLAIGAIDIAAMEWPPDHPGLAVHPWRSEPLVVIVPNDHPLARSRTVSVRQLLELELIGGERGSGTGTLLKQVLGSNAGHLRISRNLHSTEAVKNAVRSGLGCSIVLAGAVKGEAEAGRLSVLSLKGKRLAKNFYVVTQKGLPDTALAVRLASFLCDGGEETRDARDRLSG